MPGNSKAGQSKVGKLFIIIDKSCQLDIFRINRSITIKIHYMNVKKKIHGIVGEPRWVLTHQLA